MMPAIAHVGTGGGCGGFDAAADAKHAELILVEHLPARIERVAIERIVELCERVGIDRDVGHGVAARIERDASAPDQQHEQPARHCPRVHDRPTRGKL
jgi:hypothetical protein